MKSDYKQNIAFLIILLAFSVLIFFSADNSIGAVSLRQVYGRSGMFAVTVIILLWLILQGFWRKIDWLTTVGISSFFTLLVSGFWYSATYVDGTLNSISWVVISLISGMSYYFSFAYLSVMPRIFIACLLATCGIWVFTILRKRAIQPDDLYWIATLIVVHSAMYLMAVSYRHVINPYQFHDTVRTENHIFYLQGELGGYRDEDDLLFYECNSFGVFCEVVFYREVRESTPLQHPHLKFEQNEVRVYLDSDSVIYIHPE